MTQPDQTSRRQQAQQTAQALLAAQVAHARSRLLGTALEKTLSIEVDQALMTASEITLGDAVSRQTLRDVVRVFAFELDLGAGVIALSGEMAQQLHRETLKSSPKLKHLISNAHISQWLDKVLELDELRGLILEKIGQSETFHQLVSDHALMLLEKQFSEHTPDWLQRLTNGNQPLLQDNKLLSRVQQRVSRGLRQQETHLAQLLHQTVTRVIIQGCQTLAVQDRNVWRDTIWQLWQGVQDETVAELMEGLEPLDLEDFLVLGYNEWRKLRQTEYIQRLIYTGVDVFYDAYQDTALTDLLDDVGISRTHILTEMMRFAPQVLILLDERGYLNEILSRQFAPFYAQESTLQLLEQAIPPSA